MDTAATDPNDEGWSLVHADPALEAALRVGALALWDGPSGRFSKLDSLLEGLAREQIVPLATRKRLSELAGGLASSEKPRLERLRLTQGFNAAPVTCVVKRFAVPTGRDLLAVVVPHAELSRLGLRSGTAAEPGLTDRVEAERTEQPAPVPARARRPLRPVERFLWESDADGRLRAFGGALPELAGDERVARWVGRHWNELIGRDVIDLDQGLIDRLAGTATFSGHAVLWRTGPAEGMKAELSGIPASDGIRGFAVVRTAELGALPDEATEASPSAETPQPDEAVERDSDDEADRAAASAASTPPGDAAADPETADNDGSQNADAAGHECADARPPSLSAPSAGEPASGTAAVDDDETSDAAPDHDDGDPSEPALDDEPGLDAPSPEDELPQGNVVPLRNGPQPAVRPLLEPSKANLSTAERNAFREIARALGARIAGEDEAPEQPRRRASDRLAEALSQAEQAPEDAADAPEAAAPVYARQVNAHAEILDRLPVAVLVHRGDEALYANRTLLDLLDYADLDEIVSAGGVAAVIRGVAPPDGGPLTLIDRTGRFLRVDAALSSLAWNGEPASLMSFRHPARGGEVPELSEEEAEEAELAAEFAAEDAESAARVEALRLDAGVRDARIAELSAMLDTATDGVISLDTGGRILALNKTAEALFGYDQREVTGERFTLLFASESHAPALDYLEGLIGGGVASILNDGREVTGRVRQGGAIPLFMTMGRIVDGPEPRFCAVLRDITAWKKTEGELVEARRAAENASAQKSDVLAKISHEIRTPLNAIIGFAEVMADERFGPIANERYKEYLRDIYQSGGYVISLVNDLLDLAKIEAGKLDLDFESVNLNEIAVSAVALMQQQAQRGRVVLRTGLSPKLPPVVADQRSIRQIVLNLLSNAVKFTDAGGQVIISTALGDRGEAILRVRDTGIGMDDTELKLALEPFRQVPATRRSGGTGLGLPLTRALVDANRAAMSITSVKQEGTLVEITFPPQRVLAG